MAKELRDIGASVRARLLNLARTRHQAMDLLLTRYAIERLLYRLGTSRHGDRFVLKGAMLVTTWFDDPHRPTRDVDLLGYGDAAPDAMLAMFREIAAVEADDGITFETPSMRIDPIRGNIEYGGLRIRMTAVLAAARIPVVVDIGFGDAVEPGVEDIDLPTLLDFPRPHLRAYARETVIAEKFQAMVALGLANTRMKDFYDIWVLSRAYEFDPERLRRAIRATFDRRATPIPRVAPDALTPVFSTSASKQQQWAAFTRDLATDVPTLDVVCDDIAGFLMPHALEA